MMRKVKIANLVAKNSVYDKSADKFIKKMNYIMEQKIQEIEEIKMYIKKVNNIQKSQGNIYSSFSFLPWFIVLFCVLF